MVMSCITMKLPAGRHEKTKQPVHSGSNYCVCCGDEIPEGRMVCRYCIESVKTDTEESEQVKSCFDGKIKENSIEKDN